eukprot:scaffold1664_cov141-Isochrysis_galbana.AAC.1
MVDCIIAKPDQKQAVELLRSRLGEEGGVWVGVSRGRGMVVLANTPTGWASAGSHLVFKASGISRHSIPLSKARSLQYIYCPSSSNPGSAAQPLPPQLLLVYLDRISVHLVQVSVNFGRISVQLGPGRVALRRPLGLVCGYFRLHVSRHRLLERHQHAPRDRVGYHRHPLPTWAVPPNGVAPDAVSAGIGTR